MVHRLGMVVLSAALGCAGLVAASTPAGAYGTKKVAATGSIACDWVTGSVSFKPAFTTTGTVSGLVKIKGVVGSCRDASGEDGPVPNGITGGKVRGSFTTTFNRCTELAPVTSGPGSLRITWKGAQKVKPSDFSSADSRYRLDDSGAFWSMPSDVINGSGDVVGSFAGDAAAVFGDLDISATAPSIKCQPKGSGGKGVGGERKLPLVAGNLAILFTA